jgi:hypothetical protein
VPFGRPALRSLPAVVPVFPLPNVVLFPGTVVPLHIFEPRYRRMVRDSSHGDGLIGLALLRPGSEEQPGGAPAIHPVGTLGRIERLTPLADGRFDLNLVGLARVEYREVKSDKPYRLAAVRALDEREVDEEDPQILRAKLDLLAAQTLLARELEGQDIETLIVDERLPFAVTVNGACANLPVTAELRQELLLLDDIVERQRRVSRLVSSLLESVLRLKGQGRDPDARSS